MNRLASESRPGAWTPDTRTRRRRHFRGRKVRLRHTRPTHGSPEGNAWTKGLPRNGCVIFWVRSQVARRTADSKRKCYPELNCVIFLPTRRLRATNITWCRSYRPMNI